ncbi:MAG: hypothetical protein HYY32_01225 [Chloroflexi bacterium]|nr:hypothetical protein [Chloroflexota bacterium]
MRATAPAEKAGIPSVSIVASAFVEQARIISKYLGIGNLAVAEYPGHPQLDDQGTVRKKSEQVLLKNFLDALATPAKEAVRPDEPGPTDIVFKGTLNEVQDFFHQSQWSDGLPVIPPTLERVHEFLKYTDRSPKEVLGVLPLEYREATIWSVAANGVMAGCRPEYMPILVAIVETINDKEFGFQHSGSTTGWEPLIILSGPIIKQLDFNYGSGVMRVGRQANTSIGRFLRLYMRNIGGMRIPPGATDKGSIAQTFNVVLAENEDAAAEIGWQPFSVDRGFKAGENVVSIQNSCNISGPTYTAGDKPEDHLEIIAEIIGRMMERYIYYCAWTGRQNHLIVMSPGVAKAIAGAGWTKRDVKQYLYEHCKSPAKLAEKLARASGITNFTLCEYVKKGLAPKEYCESTDPDRLVPVFWSPESIGIVLSGDPGRNQTKGYASNGRQGAIVSKRIQLPAEVI